MASTTFTITSNFSGKDAQKYIHATVLKAFTLDNNGVEVLKNVGYQTNVTRLAIPENLLQEGTCAYDAQHSVTSDERTLTPTFLQVNLDLCKDEWIQTYQNVGEKSAHLDFKQDFINHLMGYIGENVGKQVERNIWQGNRTGTLATDNGNVLGKFNGFEKGFAADSAVVDVTTSAPTAGTSPNKTWLNMTDSEFEAAYAQLIDAISDDVYTHEDMLFYSPINFVRKYVRYLGQDGNGYEDKKSMWYHGLNTNLTIEGIPLFVAAGIASNRAYIAQKSNLWFGTQDSADRTKVQFIDTSDTLGDQNIRVIVRTAAGVQHGVGADVFRAVVAQS